MPDLTPLPSPSHRTLPEFLPAPVSVHARGILPRAAPTLQPRGLPAVAVPVTASAAQKPVAASEPASPDTVRPPRPGRPRPAKAKANAAKGTPEDANALTARARRCLEARRYEEALKLLLQAQRIEPTSAECRALRGYLRHLRGDASRTPERLLDEALGMDKLCERAHHYRGIVALAHHDVERAAFHFKQAVVLDPENREAALLFQRCRTRSRGLLRLTTRLQRLGYLCQAWLAAQRTGETA